MPRLISGSIHYQVAIPVCDADLDEMERAGGRVQLDENCRESLRNLAFGHAERTKMTRPDSAAVLKVLQQLLRLVIKRRTDQFVQWLSRMGALWEHERPAEEYVYEGLLHEMRVTFEPAWRDDIRSGRIDLAEVGTHLRKIRSRVKAETSSVRGGCRQHELGYILGQLARAYRSIGGRLTVSSHWSREGRVEGTRFTRFAQVFVDRLPRLPGVYRVNVGRLLHRNWKKFIKSVS